MNDSNELFIKIGNASPDGYFIYDLSNERFSYINDSFKRLCETQHTSENDLIAHLISCIHPDDRSYLKYCYQESIDEKHTVKCDFRFLFQDKSEKYFRLSINYIQFNGQDVQAGTIEDITCERHNKIHIDQINARKNIALEVLSHDLKEPFGMMRLTASSLKKDINTLKKEQLDEGLDFIREMCDRNIKMVRSLINHEFLKSSLIEIEKDRVDLVWELKDVLRFYRRSNLHSQKKFVLSCTEEKIYLRLDSMKFLQVLNNLISNSIKFTAQGGLIELGAKDLGKTVLIWVKDDGIGIPEALKPLLFNLGRQGLRPGLIGEESHGLGMSIIKSIVELHQGRIWFESDQHGTTFFIELPK